MPSVGSPIERVIVSQSRLHAFARDILVQLGASVPDATEVAEHLVAADLAGVRSHGVALLPWYDELISAGQIDPRAAYEVLEDRGTTMSVDGHFGFGQVCANAAVTSLTERARKYGLACAVGRNAGHIGRLGHYTTQLALQGLIGLMVINYQGADQDVAPYGGREGRISNDPLSIGSPAGTVPVVTDMALTAAAMVKILHVLDQGSEQVPDGWLIDSVGEATSDPEALHHGGTLLPLGGLTAGHKGYGLLVLADIFAGALSGGGVCRPGAPASFSNAFFMLALDVSWLTARDTYDAAVEQFRAHVKSSAPRAGSTEVLFPGEKEARETEQQLASGVEVERVTWDRVVTVGDRLGVLAPVR